MNNAVYFLKSVMPEAAGTVREYLNIIKSEIDASQRIIGDLLGFARSKIPQTQSVSVRDIIRQRLACCAIPDNVAIQTDLPGTLPALHVDPLQMGQVFQNLIVNAVQAIPKGGAMRVSARRVSRMESSVPNSDQGPETQNVPCNLHFIEIAITDTGEGIAPENMRKLFQPLFTTKGQGIGLGLVVTRRLTEANNGRIAGESVGWGDDVQVDVAGRGGTDREDGVKVLVVDDDRRMVKTICDILKIKGMKPWRHTAARKP
jgi:signal transduction histidine kinase